MSNTKSYISFKIEGKKEGESLRPENLDISEIREVLTDIEALLFPYTKERKGETIAYQLEEGSVIHKFIVPMLLAVQFQSIIDKLQTQNNLSLLERKQTEIIEKYQSKAQKEDLFISISTSENPQQSLKINKNTCFQPKEDIWIDTEQYVYGEIYEAGGREKTNIHIHTQEYGSLIIKATKEQARKAGNLLYKEISFLIKGKQNLETGKLKEPELLSFEDFSSEFDADYLDAIIRRVSPRWKDISIDEWLNDIRGEEANA
jgi:hypothetical protein